MKKLVLLGLLFIGLTFSFQAKADDVGVPILMYHHFTEGDNTNSLTVSKKAFEEQMAYLHNNGYKTLLFSELEAYLDGKLENDGKLVVITMDDGYKSNHDIAYPILKQYDMKATQFTIVSGIIGITDNLMRLGKYGGNHSSLDEMNEMKDVFEFQSHTYDRHMIVDGKSILARDFTDEVREDLTKAHTILEREGFPQYVFSYPYGDYTATIKSVLEENGVRLAVSVVPKRVTKNADRFELPRFAVTGSMTLEDFEKIVKAPEVKTPEVTVEKKAPEVQNSKSNKALYKNVQALFNQYLEKYLKILKIKTA